MLNTAARFWNDSTLEVNIGLLLTGIEILREPDPLISNDEDANTILMDFRLWLSSDHSPYSDLNFDVAILITRQDIHIDTNYEATGKGFVGGVCIEGMKMAIVEDDSPMGLAMSIAHELGHLLGMYHDYQYSDPLCPDKTFLMSGFTVGGPKSMQWSSCSSEAVQRFVKGRTTNCLNTHGRGEILIGDHSVGVRYNAEFQCTMLRREKSFGCNQKDACSDLSCSTSNPRASCVSVNRPPLDGTWCGEDSWCQQGLCVKHPINVEQHANNQNKNIKRFGVGASSSDNAAYLFLHVSLKVSLLLVLVIVLKIVLKTLRFCSSYLLGLHKARHGKQIWSV
ncbi:A disintegrin and metalloproteinase with thrombospondin motifs 17-like isoform X2 [Anneissia japonica]|nr:A disintegrin and metalloproteinase with thrombospondin motifs 17-like isoform X2 [Anneissia japonica]